MTVIYEQQKANEIVRSNTIDNMRLDHEVRIRDVLLATGLKDYDCPQNEESKNEEKARVDFKKYMSLPPEIGSSLLAEDAAHQVAIATVKGEHKQKREAENYERRMIATGNYKSPLENLKSYEKNAINFLRRMGYSVSKDKKKK